MATSTQREYFNREAKKCTRFRAPIEKADVDFAEVVLREFSREALEPHERARRDRTQGADEIVERRLPTGIPGELRAPQDLDREELGFPRQQLDDQAPKGLGFRGATDVSPLALLRVIDLRHIRLTPDATDASERDAGELCHLDLGVARSPQNLNLVSFEHVDHPFPRCLRQRVRDPPRCVVRRVWNPRKSAPNDQNFRNGSDQNFRKRDDQNFRNPQLVSIQR